ncbi:MAG: hypothetical protein NT135_01725 [Candidatus Berkelbacteria bacterium]|nr:hypothetical protein [Candidatus Berkelbacteria bacterium]
MARKIFSCLFAVIFVPVFIAFLFAVNFKSSFFNANYYKKSFEKSNIYSLVTEKGIPAVVKSSLKGGAESMIGPLTQDEFAKTFKDTIPPQWLKTQFEKTVDAVFAYIAGKSSSINVNISAAELKTAYGSNLTKAINEKLAAKPECGSAQIKKYVSGGMRQLPQDCKISEEYVNKGINEVLFGSQGSLKNVQDQYDLGAALSKSPSPMQSLKNFYGVFNVVYLALLISSILLLIFIMLLNIKYVPGMLKWISIPTLIASVIVLIIALFIKVIIVNIILGGLALNLSPDFKGAVTDLIKTIVSNSFNNLGIYCGIILLLSMVLLVVAVIFGKKFPPKTQTAAKN